MNKYKNDYTSIILNKAQTYTPEGSVRSNMNPGGENRENRPEHRDSSVVEPPKQNTEETGTKKFPVTKDHQNGVDTCVDWTNCNIKSTKAFMMWHYAKNFMTNKELLLGITDDGYFQIVPGLPPEEYSLLVGSRYWKTIEHKYEDEKYLVYDDTQEKDPVTGLYPEFYLMFRDPVYLKVSMEKVDDEVSPVFTIDFKSTKEYTSRI